MEESLPPYSVLLPVYARENPAYLRQSLQSMVEQDLAPAELVVVCDGPLTGELEAVLADYDARHPGLFSFVRIAENKGLGYALREGVERCRHELIARMDADDISEKNRCRLQVEAFSRDPGLIIVGGAIGEFDEDPSDIKSVRRVPPGDNEIRAFSKTRNPFNHMAVMFKKSAVLEAGNYQPMPLFEDYWLWMHLLPLGKSENLSDLLVRVRAGERMIDRRGGMRYIKNILRFQHQLWKGRHISFYRFVRNSGARVLVGVLPLGLRGRFYNIFLRKRP